MRARSPSKHVKHAAPPRSCVSRGAAAAAESLAYENADDSWAALYSLGEREAHWAREMSASGASIEAAAPEQWRSYYVN